MPGGGSRPLFFALAVAALIASAAALAISDRPRPEPEAASPAPPSPARVAAPASTRTPGGEDLLPGRGALALLAGRRVVIAAARRFLAAFLRYEVGMIDGRVARALRAGATEGFAARLLAAPPRPRAAAMPVRARLLGLRVELAPGAAPRAVVTGTLRRGGQVEGFAFEFERRGERWLAAGVAE